MTFTSPHQYPLTGIPELSKFVNRVQRQPHANQQRIRPNREEFKWRCDPGVDGEGEYASVRQVSRRSKSEQRAHELDVAHQDVAHYIREDWSERSSQIFQDPELLEQNEEELKIYCIEVLF
jgi:hypothetical protein